MSAHTPGPWIDVHRLSGSENHRGYRIASKPRKFYLAEVIPIDSDGIEGGANARLIAAAPGLLDFIQEMENAGGFGKPWHNRMRALIAKATGNSS